MEFLYNLPEPLRRPVSTRIPELGPGSASANLRVVLMNLEVGGYFNYSPPREMDASARAFAAEALANLWYDGLQPPPS